MSDAQTMTMNFEPPLNVTGRFGQQYSVASLALREPTAGEVLKSERAYVAAQNDFRSRARDRKLLATVAGVEGEVIDALPITRFQSAVTFLRGFIDTAVDPSVGEADGAAEGQEEVNQEDRPAEFVIELDTPLEKHGARFDRLILREPLTGHVLEAGTEMNTGTNAATVRAFQIALVAEVSGAPGYIIEQLPIRKLDEAFRYVAAFFRSGRKPGGS